MAAWPPSLPQAPLVDGLSEARADGVIRTDVDAGPAKRRQRYTWVPVRFSAVLVLTEAQVATLETFFEDTLGAGALAFDWTHPRTGAAVSLAFAAPYRLTAAGAGYWRADMDLELQP